MMCFNTQPPEGGWDHRLRLQYSLIGFNTQPPEGGWAEEEFKTTGSEVSTHSRPKAAGSVFTTTRNHANVSTHSRPKAAGL